MLRSFKSFPRIDSGCFNLRSRFLFCFVFNLDTWVFRVSVFKSYTPWDSLEFVFFSITTWPEKSIRKSKILMFLAVVHLPALGSHVLLVWSWIFSCKVKGPLWMLWDLFVLQPTLPQCSIKQMLTVTARVTSFLWASLTPSSLPRLCLV